MLLVGYVFEALKLWSFKSSNLFLVQSRRNLKVSPHSTFLVILLFASVNIIVQLCGLFLNVVVFVWQIQDLAIRCIQKNIKKNRGVKGWPWWKLFTTVRPLIEVQLTEEQIRGKDVSLSTYWVTTLVVHSWYVSEIKLCGDLMHKNQ